MPFDLIRMAFKTESRLAMVMGTRWRSLGPVVVPLLIAFANLLVESPKIIQDPESQQTKGREVDERT